MGVLDKSAVRAAVRGDVADLAGGSGWIAKATALPARAVLGDHVHDLPYLSLHLLGAYDEEGEAGAVAIHGPAAAFHPAGSAHSDRIGPHGLRTVIVQFEPAWLRRALGAGVPATSRYWASGPVAAAATRLARRALAADRAAIADEAVALIRAGLTTAGPAAPDWLARVEDLLAEGGVESVDALARRLGLTPAWLARAWRAATGEGLADRLRRRRLEQAVHLLETGGSAIADVAYRTGFADQSHLTRVCKAVLGVSPGRLRAPYQ